MNLPPRQLERISIEVTNRCAKACWFCYSHSTPAGRTQWTVDELASFVSDCADHGVKAVSFGGGEPLQFEGLFDLLTALRGRIFRSITSNGLLLDGALFERLIEAAPDKVHLSIHFPHNAAEVSRVIRQVHALAERGMRSGINLLVAQSNLPAAQAAANQIREAGIDNSRIVYLPMRGQDTPTPQQVAAVAGNQPFQSMSCLSACASSLRFCSISWDKTAAWCSYTQTRRRLAELSYNGLQAALDGLGLQFCGGADGR